MKRTVLGLALRVTYRAHGRVKVVPRMIVGQNGPACNPSKTINLTNVQLQVPDLTPSNNSLRVIKFDYVIMVSTVVCCVSGLYVATREVEERRTQILI